MQDGRYLGNPTEYFVSEVNPIASVYNLELPLNHVVAQLKHLLLGDLRMFPW